MPVYQQALSGMQASMEEPLDLALLCGNERKGSEMAVEKLFLDVVRIKIL